MNLEKLFEKIGLTKEEYTKIINNYSLKKFTKDTLYNNLEIVFNTLLEIGYSKKAIIKMVKSQPTILGLSKENIDKKIEDLIDLGYRKEEVIEMTTKQSTLFSYSIDNIKEKHNNLLSLGYSLENV